MADDGIRVFRAPGCRGMSFADILDGLLYLGPAAVPVQEPERLTQLGVTHVLNLTMSEPCNNDAFQCKHVVVEDDASQPLRPYFEECFSFIDSILLPSDARRGVVYVHCVAGVSRSATIVIAYLMKSHRKSLREAYEHVRARRPFVSPNVGFFEQLCAWEKELYVSRTGSEQGFGESYPLAEYHAHCLRQVFPDVKEDVLQSVLGQCGGNVVQAETMLLDMLVRGELV